MENFIKEMSESLKYHEYQLDLKLKVFRNSIFNLAHFNDLKKYIFDDTNTFQIPNPNTLNMNMSINMQNNIIIDKRNSITDLYGLSNVNNHTQNGNVIYNISYIQDKKFENTSYSQNLQNKNDVSDIDTNNNEIKKEDAGRNTSNNAISFITKKRRIRHKEEPEIIKKKCNQIISPPSTNSKFPEVKKYSGGNHLIVHEMEIPSNIFNYL